METYKVYPKRWGVLFTVFLFNVANNVIWISFSAVATTAAEYFEKPISQIDLLSSISFFVGIPFCLGCTVIIDRLGLR